MCWPLEAKRLVLFAFYAPAAYIPLRGRGYPLPRLDLSNFRSHPPPSPPLVDQQLRSGVTTHTGARLVQRCVRQENFPSLDQGLDGGPVSLCLRAWRRSNSRTPAFAPHRMTRSNTLLPFGAPPPRSALKKVCSTIPLVQNKKTNFEPGGVHWSTLEHARRVACS